MPWLMDEMAIYCFHCLLGNVSKWLGALLWWLRRWLVEWFEQCSAVNNNMVGVVYNSIMTTRWQGERQRPAVTGVCHTVNIYLCPHFFIWFLLIQYYLCLVLIATTSTQRHTIKKYSEKITESLLKWLQILICQWDVFWWIWSNWDTKKMLLLHQYII